MEIRNHIRLDPKLRIRRIPFSCPYSSRGALNVCSKTFVSQTFRTLVPSFIFHSAVSLTPSPLPLPKPVLHTVRSSASSFNFQYHLLSLSLPVAAYVFLLIFPSLLPSIFPSVPCFRRQFLPKFWPIQLALLFLFHVWYSRPPWPLRLLHDRSNRPTPSFFSTTFQNFRGISDLSEMSNFQHITKLNSKYSIFTGFFLKF